MSRLSKTFMPPNSVNGCWLPTLISPICTSLSVTEFPLINEFYRINKWVAARLTGLFVVQGRLNITGEQRVAVSRRSEEHTSELQSRGHLVCRLLLEKKN